MSKKIFHEMLKKNLLRLYDKKVPEALYGFRQLVTDHFKINQCGLENFYKFPYKNFTKKSLVALESKFKRRISHEPIQYIIGNWHFAELNLIIKKPVFIPRPETPQIVDICQDLINEKLKSEKNIDFLELGVGSGAISIQLLKRLGDKIKGTGIDVNKHCVDLSNQNKIRNLDSSQISRINFFHKDFYKFNQENKNTYSFIISNPPYVSFQDYSNLEKQILLYESKLAFVSENDGLKFTIDLLKFAERHLKKPEGFVLLELCPKTIDLLEQGIITKKNDIKMKIYKVYKDIYGENRFVSLFLR